MPVPEATPPPPPIATAPQVSSLASVVFQWGFLVLAEGWQDSELPAPSVPVEIRRRVTLPSGIDFGLIDIGAVVGVLGRQEAVGGREEDLGAVFAHPVKEDAGGGAGGQVDGFGGVADVHVEVPVAVLPSSETSWPMTIRRAVARRRRARRSPGRSSSARPGSWRPVGFLALQVAVIDVDVAVVVGAFGSSFALEPKMKWAPSAERWRPMKPAGSAFGSAIEPASPWISSPFGRWIGLPVEPSAKQGEQISGPPKAKVPKRGVGFEQGRGEGAGRVGVVGGDADVFGAPAIFTAGRDVGVDAAVGRVAGAGDAAVVDAVEDLRGALGVGIAAEGRLAWDQVGLDVIATGVGGGDQLVGAAVEQQRGAGLLAHMRRWGRGR